MVVLCASDTGLIRITESASMAAGASCRVVDVLDAVAVEGADLIIIPAEAFDDARRLAPDRPVLIIGDAKSSDQAIELITRGAIDYLVRPVPEAELVDRIRAGLRIAREARRPADYDRTPTERDDVVRIVGQSPAMQEMYKTIGRIAPQNINVLITGESGVGKELVARAILHHSQRRDKPYLAVNCAAIPETLLESELFGHEQGAFTGADRRRIGTFEQCHGGTLFLDEIGDIPLATQAKLLRVLQDQTFQRLGGSESITCDVRILAATHQPLDALMAERRFRPDLFYRLNVATVHVPPLREREVDVVLLAHYFVEQYNRQFGTEVRSFAPETLPILLSHTWPGNVRELENAIKATLVMARGSVLHPEFLPEAVRDGAAAAMEQRPAASGDAPRRIDVRPGDDNAFEALVERWLSAGHGEALRAARADVERALIRAELRRHQGRAAPAARQLGISRTTLRKKMGEYGINITAT